jgi:hypothetical protein
MHVTTVVYRLSEKCFVMTHHIYHHWSERNIHCPPEIGHKDSSASFGQMWWQWKLQREEMGWGNTRSLGCLVIVFILSGHLSMHACLNCLTPKFDIAEQQIHFRNSNGCDIDTRALPWMWTAHEHGCYTENYGCMHSLPRWDSFWLQPHAVWWRAPL